MRFLWLLLVFSITSVNAKNLGTFGHLWPIGEQNFLSWVRQKLEKMQGDGTLAVKEREVRKRVREHTLHPASLDLTTTVNPKKFYYDPTFTVSHDIADNNGRVFARKGQRFNPLKIVPFNETLWFIDADDSRQVQWLEKELEHFKHNKIILTGGSIKDTYHMLKKRVYFDQKGTLSKKFGLKHVPVRIERSGDRLMVTEINIDKESGRSK